MNILMLYFLCVCMLVIMLVSGHFIGFKASVNFYACEKCSSKETTASQLAEKLIAHNKLLNVKMSCLNAKKTNYYSASYNVIKLSPEVKNSNNLSALAKSAYCANQARLSHRFGFLYIIKTAFSFISKPFPIIFIPLTLVCAILHTSTGASVAELLILITLIGTLTSFLIEIIIFLFEVKSVKSLIKDIKQLDEFSEEETKIISSLLYDICKADFYMSTRLILKFLALLNPDPIFKQNNKA